jgi:NADPH2:quinone reductase
MRGITVKEFGGPEVLQYVEDLPAPASPTGNKVLVQVKSVGVNPVDTYIRSGTHVMKPTLPYTPGSDGAGVVQEVGPLVTKFKKGDRVFWCQFGTGSYAELALIDDAHVYPLHASLSFPQGAALGVPYFSALRAVVTKARLLAGERVLIHGASGAVGLACVQIARALGATVLGTAGTEEGLQLIRSNGAHQAFNHRQPGYLDEIKSVGSIDVIVEMLANVNLEKDLELAGAGTRIIIVGSRGRIEVTPRLVMTSEAVITGIQLWKASPGDWREMVALLSAGQEGGWARPVVGQEFPLAQAADAQRQVIEQTGGSKGKIVLTV